MKSFHKNMSKHAGNSSANLFANSSIDLKNKKWVPSTLDLLESAWLLEIQEKSCDRDSRKLK